MKSLVPWICLLAASTSHQAFAEDDFNAYRLGYYNKAAESLLVKAGKNPVADYYLGRLYLYGYGQLKNTNLAMRYFAKAAEKNYLPAVQALAKFTLFQEKKPELALRWFKQAASLGDVNAQMFMAAANLYGIGGKPNSDAATKYYIDAAKNGNAVAQYTLAAHFLDGRNSSNNRLGLIWLNKSAANDNPSALTKLGRLYLEGKLVTKDQAKGLTLINKAVAQNFAPAMIALGDIAINEKEYNKAIDWFNKAINLHSSEAYLHLAHMYFIEKTPVFDTKTGFLWTLKAAQEGSPEAKRELANLYTKGVGVEASQDLAKQWIDQASADESKKAKSALAYAALWLSNNTTDQLENTTYEMKGIFGAWQNAQTLRDNIYNQAPQMGQLTRKDIFKPQFTLTEPNEVPINSYYDAINDKKVSFEANQWTYPQYRLNKHIEELQKENSLVMAKEQVPAPLSNANYYSDEDYASTDLMDLWTPDLQKQANYRSVFNQLYGKAILGEAQSQFEIGQMFEYGLGVEQSYSSAMAFYQNAADQQHLGAEYNLGLLNLLHPQDQNSYQTALNWLNDSAFKGNKKAQYVLARLLEQGVNGENGQQYIKPNHEQATSMLYLSAANEYGPAQFDLAEKLSKQNDGNLSIEAKNQKASLMRQLYEGAAESGVRQALLPLAFYNAMEKDKSRQEKAFAVAKEQAEAGDERAALLLGLLYDRGIGVGIDPVKAVEWYKLAGKNSASQFILGTYVYEGKGLPQNKEEGMALLKSSAEAKFAYADFNLAALYQMAGKDFLPELVDAYHLGNGHAGIVLADYYLANHADAEKMQQAKQIYIGLAEKGDPVAQLKLAYMLQKGLGSAPDFTTAQHWYTVAAEQGNSTAQYLLGQFYQLGETGQPDYQLAKSWYQKATSQYPNAYVAIGFINETVEDNYKEALKAYEQAALKGDTKGVYDLALMYLYGKGMPVDFQKSKVLLTDASSKGVHEAMDQLAGMYFNGLGLTKDEQQAFSWYQKAAELGDSNALYQLGLLSETGLNTKLDFVNALKFYQAAANKGNEKALLAQARMYHFALGVDKDLKKAANIYQTLASRQNAYAQYQLGTFYLEGMAGEQSLDKGKQLLKQSSENGSVQARQLLQKMEAQQPTIGSPSIIEPVKIHPVAISPELSADSMYFEALNTWDRGDELRSREILKQLISQYPQFVPAQWVKNQLNTPGVVGQSN